MADEMAPMRDDVTSSRSYRPDIDGLRAIAVAAVIVFHAFPQYLPGGYTQLRLSQQSARLDGSLEFRILRSRRRQVPRRSHTPNVAGGLQSIRNIAGSSMRGTT
jgi:peptidoglycan/LPS O-acetylase OafA/YrhL